MNRRTTTSRRTRARRPARATRRTAPWTTSCSWRSSTRSACCPPKCTPPSNPSRPRKCTSTQVRHSGNLHHGQWLVVHTTSNCCNTHSLWICRGPLWIREGGVGPERLAAHEEGVGRGPPGGVQGVQPHHHQGIGEAAQRPRRRPNPTGADYKQLPLVLVFPCS